MIRFFSSTSSTLLPKVRKFCNGLLRVMLDSCRAGDAIHVLDEMPDLNSGFSATGELVFGELARMGRSFLDGEVVGLVAKLGERRVFPDAFKLTQLVSKMCGERKIDVAWEVLYCVMRLGGKVEAASCNALLTGLGRERDIGRMNELLAEMNYQKLTLSKLPNLENVWNEDPHEILRMQHLQQVYVDNCKCLVSVFPASVAEDLVKLEDLVVQQCEGLMTIVAEDNADPKGTNLELTFTSMVSLTLWDLPKFKYFYYCSLQCDMLKTDSNLEPHTVNQVCPQKLAPKLEHLTLGENELKVIWKGEFQENVLHKLKVLILVNHLKSNVFKYGCVTQVSNKDKLEMSCYSFEVIFCYKSSNVDDTGPQSEMKILTLESLPEPFLRNLEFLEVSRCSCLANLAPLHVCFSNLTCLFVFECHRLENLFTSSTAKSLSQLKIMEIKDCESIKEIVSMEEDGPNEDEIIFGKLLYLNLEYLPNLTSFYKGCLSFPSLVQFSVINCHNMENLCEGSVNADKLLEVKFQNNSGAVPLEIDLNSTIQKALHATAFDYLSSSSSDTSEDGQYGTPRGRLGD